MLPSLLVHASGRRGSAPQNFYPTGSFNLIIRARSARDQNQPSLQPSDGAAGAAGVSGAGSDEAAAGGGAPAPFFFPIASITRARYDPGSLSRRTNCVAGAFNSPSNWLKITSRDGNVASAFTSAGVSALPSSTAPRSFSFSPRGPNDVNVFASTTGSS